MTSASSSIVENSAAGVLSASPVASAENAQMRLELEKVKEQMLKLQLRLDESGREKKEDKTEETNRFNNLTYEQLVKEFGAALGKGDCQSLQSIIISSNFRDWEVGETTAVASALARAAQAGNLPCVQAIISSKHFKTIPIAVRFGLGHALGLASREGKLLCVQEIIACNRFKELSAAGLYGLGHALLCAAMSGHHLCLQAIIACDRFKEIPATGDCSVQFGLGNAFEGAAGEGHFECLQAIMTCNRFKEIPEKGPCSLERARSFAIEQRQYAVAESLAKLLALIEKQKSECVIL